MLIQGVNEGGRTVGKIIDGDKINLRLSGYLGKARKAGQNNRGCSFESN